jgi:hypothetical protein
MSRRSECRRFREGPDIFARGTLEARLVHRLGAPDWNFSDELALPRPFAGVGPWCRQVTAMFQVATE